MKLSLNRRLLELEHALVHMDARLEVEREKGGIRAALIANRDGAVISSMHAASVPAALTNLHRSLHGWFRGDTIEFESDS